MHPALHSTISAVGRGRSRRRARLVSTHAEQFHFENQRRVWRDDAAGAAGAVTERRRNRELALAAHFHALHSLVPAADDLALTQPEYERIVAVFAGIELGSVGEPASVMNGDALARSGGNTFADGDLVDAETAGGLLGGHQSFDE